MIIDTNRRTTSRLPCLAGEGVTSIIRYYARTTQQPEKRLTRAEAQAIIEAGLAIGIVAQSAGNSANYFTQATGVQDGVYARNYGASVIGQPNGSAIYFAVDYDASPSQVNNRIVPYFEAIRETFQPSPNLPEYRIGVYGNGTVCKTLLDQGLVEFTWLSQSTGHHGHAAFKNSNRWTLFQHLSSQLCGIGVDKDDLRPGLGTFGQFDQLVEPSDMVTEGGDALADLGAPGAAADLTFNHQEFIDWVTSQNFQHFKPYELLVMGGAHGNPQSPCHGKNTFPPRHLWQNIVPTVRMLDLLRARLNAPIRITSAYRSPAYNSCIGGAGQSAHMEFQAIDFIAEGNSRPADWARILRSMRDDELQFKGGVGVYTGFVHVDTNGVNRDW